MDSVLLAFGLVLLIFGAAAVFVILGSRALRKHELDLQKEPRRPA